METKRLQIKTTLNKIKELIGPYMCEHREILDANILVDKLLSQYLAKQDKKKKAYFKNEESKKSILDKANHNLVMANIELVEQNKQLRDLVEDVVVQKEMLMDKMNQEGQEETWKQ